MYDSYRACCEDMMSKSMAVRSATLLRLVEQRALSRKELEEEKKKEQESLIPYLPEPLISKILVRLPLESLPRSRFVCKPWYKIVNDPVFINDYLGRSETVLVFLSPVLGEPLHPYFRTSIPNEKPNTFSVEAKLFQLQSIPLFCQPLMNPGSKFYIKFMEIKDGKSRIGDFNATCLGNIRATCNGLILLDNTMKKGGLVVMNPVTRELTGLPLGTLFSSHDESFGLAFCNSTSGYKLVHLFRDELRYIGCEILNLGMRSWRMVDGPSFGLFGWFGFEPVSALGALHWIPHIDHSEYIVSMEINEEKFHNISLPKSCRSNDRIVDIGGRLCFMTREEMNQIDMWMLGNLSGENWTKEYTIMVGCITDMIPLYCSRINREMIFKDKDGSLYAYDFHLEIMRKVEIKNRCFPVHGFCLPHVNSLVSWRIQEDGEDAGD
ncbi:unnamed protein product [Ilex paraguariensis]|uniref:F-box domain-containing protein n=1 Tax=Ilex paraguariensis TaxID=185542 RepID=A0ABC8TG44_9AQUA